MMRIASSRPRILVKKHVLCRAQHNKCLLTLQAGSQMAQLGLSGDEAVAQVYDGFWTLVLFKKGNYATQS